MADRHGAREVRLLQGRPHAGALSRSPRHPGTARRHAGSPRLGADPRRREHHRACRSDRRRRDLARAGRAVRALRCAAPLAAPDVPRSACPLGAGETGRRPARHRLPRPRHEPEMEALRDAGHAEIALQDHGELHAEGRQARPRHDVPHLHGAGEPRFFRRGRHARQDACRARAAADRHRALREFPLHREPSERLPLLPLGDLARHRSEPHRHAAFCLSRRLRLREIRRLGARRADVFRRPRRPLPRHDELYLPAVHGGVGAERSAFTAADDGRLEEPPLDALPGSQAQNISRDARRRRRAMAAALRAAGAMGGAPLRPDLARRCEGAHRRLDGGGAAGASRRGAEDGARHQVPKSNGARYCARRRGPGAQRADASRHLRERSFRRGALPASARRDAGAREDAGGKPDLAIPDPLGPLGRADLRGTSVPAIPRGRASAGPSRSAPCLRRGHF